MELRKTSLYSTIDMVPQMEHYAGTLPCEQAKSRPSLEALRKTFEVSFPPFVHTYLFLAGGNMTSDERISNMPDGENEESQGPSEESPVRFGWIYGVKIPCMMNIWGVTLFLQLTWITSQAGIVLTVIIILMSVTVTTATALSISAIATNGRVVSGGTYFMISRSLGPELGASIGLIFSFANALSVALNTVGFAQVVCDLMQSFNVHMVDYTNDMRIVGVITVTALLGISLAGMEWETKAQILFFLVLMVSFANYFVGTIIPHSVEKQGRGVFGYRSDIFIENLTPNWRGPTGSFFAQFSIFFPAVTGILYGANITGDLKDPSSAIPKGTLMAIFWTTLSYIMVAVTSGACVVRDASGNTSDIMTGNSTDGCVGLACKYGWNFTQCTESQSCQYGLANNVQVMAELSGFYYLITAGVFAASLSSALGYLVSAPKIFQCLCKDNIYPYIGVFAKGYGKNDEPLRAYLLTYFIAIAFILIAELNTISAIISNFFLCSFGLINISCFHAAITNSPGWRPSFPYYNKWIALYGAVVCVVLMFFFTWWTALITFGVIAVLFGYIIYKKPKINWGSSVQARAKTPSPQCLVMTGPPNQRPALVDFVGAFTKNASLMICGDIMMVSQPANQSVKWLNKRKACSFYTQFTANTLREGVRYLLQASGLGKLKPNTLVLGFKSNWRESSPESIGDYIHTIYDTFDSKFCLCILRMMDGLDVSDESDFKGLDQIKTVFQTAQGKKTIDVYWIADDGGLTLLVPYLLTRRKRWHSCKIRVFIVENEQDIEERRNEMINLMKRFRIKVNDVIVMTDSEKSPQTKKFLDSVAPFRLHDEQQEGVSVQELRQKDPWKISDKEFEALRLKSERKVRLNEIIRKNSQHTALVLV
uniref:Solute carrier family 12 member 10, tandem duplicate 1 n=1 Tax=Oreochromis niloticus TaxID=8128 RepID=A0A669BB69_ORENI